MTPVEILLAARKRIETPDGWCRGAFALDGGGNPVRSDDETACRWCAHGAVMSVSRGTPEYRTAIEALEATAEGYTGLYVLNDRYTHAEVLAAFDRAIEALT